MRNKLVEEPESRSAFDVDRADMDSMNISAIERAILSVLAYHDQFDYPLSLSEIHYFLHNFRCQESEVRDAIKASAVLRALLISDGQHYALATRQEILDTRLRRQERAARKWPSVRRLGGILFNLPCVRYVGLTGSMAANNPGSDADIDFMMITEFGVMWRVRALAKVIQKFDRHFGSGGLCANYMLTTEGLEIQPKRLYVAHELAMMVPLFGSESYDALIAANRWARSFLPNASGSRLDSPICDEVPMPRLRRAAEWISLGPIGRAVERYESGRKLYLYNETDYLEGRWSRFSHRASGHRLHIADAIEEAWRERLKTAAAGTGRGK